MLMLLLELGILIVSIFLVNRDISKNKISRKVFWVWVLGTAVAYIFLWIYGVIATVFLYFGWSRAFLKRMGNNM